MQALPRKHLLALIAMLTLVIDQASGSQQASDSALISMLRQGGYVFVMHHASSPIQTPDKISADPTNTQLERQLDQQGIDTSIAMGKAIKQLKIPIGMVESSKTFRAMQTAKYAGFAAVQGVTELTEGEQGMAHDANQHRAEWLQNAVRTAPIAGVNTVLITHTPNMMAAFGDDAKGIQASEIMVFHPNGKGGTALVTRIPAELWPKLLAAGS